MQINEALSLIFNGLLEYLSSEGFSAVYPEGVESPELPVTKEGNKTIISFSGNKGNVKLVHEDKKLSLLTTEVTEDLEDSDFKSASVSLLNLETVEDSDIKYIIDEFTETLRETYSENTASKSTNKKIPTPVSKSAAKSGVASYDPNTLATRLFALYPETKEYHRMNIEKYGEFLCEEFFQNYIVSNVINTIRSKDTQKNKKLFNILNDIYDNGTNETQSLIVVTILGAMNNDADLLETAKKYMDKTLAEPVVATNQILASSSGKSLVKKLENPPLYKPKKKKSKQKGMFSQMLGI